MDRRLTRSNGQVAHVSLRGKVDATKFVEGDWQQVVADCTSILAKPNGPRTRELLRGQEFCVLDTQDDHTFGFTRHDGYCGYVLATDLGPAKPTTHVVCVQQTYMKEVPDLKASGRHLPLSFGTRLTKSGEENGWTQLSLLIGKGGSVIRYVPDVHLQPIAFTFKDPASVAKLFVGTPYLWGGNSSFGIDCSGLIQASLLACDHSCPGDSDLQEQALGHTVSQHEPIRSGDLFFWQGHVAMAVDDSNLIHANAHHMAVTLEPIDITVKRIAQQGGGPVTSRKRI